MSDSKQIIFIVGPTAVGKSDVAFKLARRLFGEIVSCDSMQVYKEINIASAKSSAEDMKLVPHHLVNIVSVEEECDVVRMNRLAVDAIHEVHQRGSVPIVVGGSGLYMQVMLDGIFEGGENDPALRAQLTEQEADQPGSLFTQLKNVDPAAAERIHPHDIKRLIRALEVYLMKDRPISELQKERSGLWGQYDIRIYYLVRDRAELYRMIEDRVDRMFKLGVVEEISALQNVSWSLTARSLIGVKEILGYCRGEYPIEDAKALLKMHTRRLAKRQMTWFRKESRCQTIYIDEHVSTEETSRFIYDTEGTYNG